MSLPDVEPSIKFVQVRHEEMAAFMACPRAKFTGEVGICLATSGPGAVHLLGDMHERGVVRQSFDQMFPRKA